jgi:hypothetical protein
LKKIPQLRRSIAVLLFGAAMRNNFPHHTRRNQLKASDRVLDIPVLAPGESETFRVSSGLRQFGPDRRIGRARRIGNPVVKLLTRRGPGTDLRPDVTMPAIAATRAHRCKSPTRAEAASLERLTCRDYALA